MNKKDLIIGSKGMIGKAIYKCYDKDYNVLKYDLDSEEHILIANEDNIRCMHICIPCKDKNKFIDTVIKYIVDINPEITILHSTVPVGTSREIYNNIPFRKNEGNIVVHSFCRGKHPDLYKSIKSVFWKYWSQLPNSKEAKSKVYGIMSDLFDKQWHVKNPETSEFGKLYSTTQYLWQIAITTAIHEDSKDYPLVDFNQAYSLFNVDYNVGYTEIGEKKFCRPVLTPCKDKISGHCLRENLRLLRIYGKESKLLNPPIKKEMYYLK